MIKNMPILVNEKTCLDGCTICDFFCPGDIIYRETKEDPPVIKYPDECWYCGGCVLACPVDALTVNFPPEMLHSQTDVRSLLQVTDINEKGQ